MIALELALIFEMLITDVRTSGPRREQRKCDVMHFLHVAFQGFPFYVSFIALIALELAKRGICCDVMDPPRVIFQSFFPSESFVTLVAPELLLVFWSARLWMVFLVVFVQLFNVVVVTLTDLTDDVSRCHLQYKTTKLSSGKNYISQNKEFWCEFELQTETFKFSINF